MSVVFITLFSLIMIGLLMFLLPYLENWENRSEKMEGEITSIGKRIGELIEKRNLTQTEVSKETGLSQNAISNYINGHRIPDTKAIFKTI